MNVTHDTFSLFHEGGGYLYQSLTLQKAIDRPRSNYCLNLIYWLNFPSYNNNSFVAVMCGLLPEEVLSAKGLTSLCVEWT